MIHLDQIESYTLLICCIFVGGAYYAGVAVNRPTDCNVTSRSTAEYSHPQRTDTEEWWGSIVQCQIIYNIYCMLVCVTDLIHFKRFASKVFSKCSVDVPFKDNTTQLKNSENCSHLRMISVDNNLRSIYT